MSKPVFQDLFTLSGRRNRKSYFFYLVAMLLFLSIVWGVVAGVVDAGGRAHFADLQDGYGHAGSGEVWAVIVAGIITLLAAISGWIVAAQRCRDFGWTGWAVLITLLPAVGWLFGLALIFIPGTLGPNRYGPDPLGGFPGAAARV
jgi:uncharacterized membrane protein YhaH (DUF805 family)